MTTVVQWPYCNFTTVEMAPTTNDRNRWRILNVRGGIFEVAGERQCDVFLFGVSLLLSSLSSFLPQTPILKPLSVYGHALPALEPVGAIAPTATTVPESLLREEVNKFPYASRGTTALLRGGRAGNAS